MTEEAKPPTQVHRITFSSDVPPEDTTKGKPLDEALYIIRQAAEEIEKLKPYHGGASYEITIDRMGVSPAPLPVLTDEVKTDLERLVRRVVSDLCMALDYAAVQVYEQMCRGQTPHPRVASIGKKGNKATPNTRSKRSIYYPFWEHALDHEAEWHDQLDQNFPGLRDGPTPNRRLLFETIAGGGQFSPGLRQELPVLHTLAGRAKHRGLLQLCYAEAGPKVDKGAGPQLTMSVQVLSVEGGPSYIYPYLRGAAQHIELCVTKIKELLGEPVDWGEYYARAHPEDADRIRRDFARFNNRPVG